MKILPIILCLFLFWTATGNASLSMDFDYRLEGEAYYHIYNHNWYNDHWAAWEGFAGAGSTTDIWTVMSDYSNSGQVQVEALIETIITWDVRNSRELENLFFTVNYHQIYLSGFIGPNHPPYNEFRIDGSLELTEGTGTVSFAYKKSILATIGEEYVIDVYSDFDTPIISADPWTVNQGPNFSADSGAFIHMNLISRITYLLPTETSAPVPEPSSVLLFGTGLASLAAVGRRKGTNLFSAKSEFKAGLNSSAFSFPPRRSASTLSRPGILPKQS